MFVSCVQESDPPRHPLSGMAFLACEFMAKLFTQFLSVCFFGIKLPLLFFMRLPRSCFASCSR